MRFSLLLTIFLCLPVRASSFGDWVKGLKRDHPYYRGTFEEKPIHLKGPPREVYDALVLNSDAGQLGAWLIEARAEPELHSKMLALFLMWDIRRYRGMSSKSYPEPLRPNEQRVQDLLSREFIIGMQPDYVRDVVDQLLAERTAAGMTSTSALAGARVLFRLLDKLGKGRLNSHLERSGDVLCLLAQRLDAHFRERYRDIHAGRPEGRSAHPSHAKVETRMKLAQELLSIISAWGIPLIDLGGDRSNASTWAEKNVWELLNVLTEAAQGAEMVNTVARLLDVRDLPLDALLTARDILSTRGAGPDLIACVDDRIHRILPAAIRDWRAGKPSIEAIIACARIVAGDVDE